MRNDAGKGKVYYGMHMYPGVAEYRPEGADMFRIFVTEDTIRSMDASFAGRPVFVMHVDGVEQNVDKLREEADGWVVESFYNEADGKHWVKFLVVSERGENAIAQGMKLSNAYEPRRFGPSGVWNGVDYDREMQAGEYEHLAIVPDPRYAESIILTPEQYKAYCEEKKAELQRLANQNSEKGKGMKLKLWNRKPVENSADLETLSVQLPKSGRELTIIQLVNEADERAEKEKKDKEAPPMANGEHMVEHGGEKMSVNELMKRYNMLNDEMKELKAKHYDDNGREKNEGDDDANLETVDAVVVSEADHHNEDDDEAAKRKAEEIAAHEEKELKEKHKNEMEALRKKHGKPKESADELEARRKAKEKADKVRNAQERTNDIPAPKVEDSLDQVARGKARYGSN